MTRTAGRFRSLVGVPLCVSALALASACHGSNPSGGSAAASTQTAADDGTVSAQARAEARRLFGSRCTPCHGPQGLGNGPAAATLNPHPRNFHDAAWQKAVTDDEIEKAIQYGGAAVSKSPNMPANPDLGSKPEVIRALRAHIRSLVAH